MAFFIYESQSWVQLKVILDFDILNCTPSNMIDKSESGVSILITLVCLMWSVWVDALK